MNDNYVLSVCTVALIISFNTYFNAGYTIDHKPRMDIGYTIKLLTEAPAEAAYLLVLQTQTLFETRLLLEQCQLAILNFFSIQCAQPRVV